MFFSDLFPQEGVTMHLLGVVLPGLLVLCTATALPFIIKVPQTIIIYVIPNYLVKIYLINYLSSAVGKYSYKIGICVVHVNINFKEQPEQTGIKEQIDQTNKNRV